jgi:hypothetical protein
VSRPEAAGADRAKPPSPGGAAADPAQLADRLTKVWEREAGEAWAAVVRDPRVLALSAASLRAGLDAARAGRLLWEAWWRAATALGPVKQ